MAVTRLSNLLLQNLSGQITTTQITNGAVTQVKRAALGQQVSASSAGFSTSNTTFTDVTNLSVSIPTTGRPVTLVLIPDETAPGIGQRSLFGISEGLTSASQLEGKYRFLRGSTTLGEILVGGFTVTNPQFSVFPGVVVQVDIVAAGTYTYKLQVKVESGPADAMFLASYLKLVAFEQ